MPDEILVNDDSPTADTELLRPDGDGLVSDLPNLEITVRVGDEDNNGVPVKSVELPMAVNIETIDIAYLPDGQNPETDEFIVIEEVSEILVKMCVLKPCLIESRDG
jgi:hypothetical protein